MKVSTNLTKDDLSYLSSIGIKPENKVILSLGRLEDTQKGFSFGIKAMALLKDKYPNLIYIIAGKGPDMEMYKKSISKYNLEGRVKLLGYVTDEQKYSLFRRSDVFLLPSSGETFGLVIVEAMHFGKPIITTKNEGSIDIIKDGYNGFFAERDEKDIADKVHKVLSLDKVRLAEIRKNSLATAKSFSVEKMIKRYKKTIKNVI
jgi:glycosyltransferase involved in cell wall biosynthesis